LYYGDNRCEAASPAGSARGPLVAQWPNDAHGDCFWVRLADLEPVKHMVGISFL
jgi:hypothetical protein